MLAAVRTTLVGVLASSLFHVPSKQKTSLFNEYPPTVPAVPNVRRLGVTPAVTSVRADGTVVPDTFKKNSVSQVRGRIQQLQIGFSRSSMYFCYVHYVSAHRKCQHSFRKIVLSSAKVSGILLGKTQEPTFRAL